MTEFLRNRKALISLTGGIAFILLYLVFYIFPTLNRIKVLKETLPQKEQEVKEMESLSSEYLNLKKEYSPKEILSAESESIFSLVERIAKSKGLSENISSIKPLISSVKEGDTQEMSVEVKIKDLTLQNLVSYLFTLEGPPYNLKIKEIQINSPKDSSSIEVSFTASRWEKKK